MRIHPARTSCGSDSGSGAAGGGQRGGGRDRAGSRVRVGQQHQASRPRLGSVDPFDPCQLSRERATQRTEWANRRTRTWPTTDGAIRVVSIFVLAGAACSPSSVPATAPLESSANTGSDAPRTYALGEFPPFPDGPLSESTAEALQAALDGTVEEGTFTGVTAAVIAADRGSWAGAAGSGDGVPLTPDSPSPTHSSGKTVAAAQVLRLAEDGILGLDDPASDHLPRSSGSSTRTEPRSGRCWGCAAASQV